MSKPTGEEVIQCWKVQLVYLLVAKGNQDHKGELKRTDPSQSMGGFFYTVTCNTALHESNKIKYFFVLWL